MGKTKKTITADSEIDTAEETILSDDGLALAPVEANPVDTKATQATENAGYEARLQEKDAQIQRLTESYKAVQRTLSVKDIESKKTQLPMTNAQKDFIERASRLWQYALDAGLSKEGLAEVNDCLAEGSLKGAINSVKRLQSQKAESSYEKRLGEAKRQWMEEYGMLESETGGPSGAAKKSFADIEAGFAAGKVDFATYAAAREREGLEN